MLVKIEECAGCGGQFHYYEVVVIFLRETYCEECYREATDDDEETEN